MILRALRHMVVTMACVMTPVTFALSQEAEAPDVPPIAEPPMTMQRMAEIIRAIDPDAQAAGNSIQFIIDDIPLVVIADPGANRMRANFDTALDARYAVAQGRLWGVFIHPLSSLEKDQLLSAFVQTINVARSYGQSYSGGATVFGGGDSNGIYQDLFRELQDLGEDI